MASDAAVQDGIKLAAGTPYKVMLLASYAPSLVTFRGPLLQTLAAHGHATIGCAVEDDAETAARLGELGVSYRRVPMDRTGTNPLADLRTLAALIQLLRAERPDLLLAYTLKPVVYGGLAARLAGVPRFFGMITGLGYAFGEAATARRRRLQQITTWLYRLALRRAEAVFFFNPDDRHEFERRQILRPRQRVVMVNGSGVDTAHYREAPLPEGPPVFLLVARMLREKGLFEFAEAARRLRARWPQARFWLLGPLDANPGSLAQSQLDAWRAEGIIDYQGATRDVRPYLAACSVFVLPSYYREGIPRTALEAMATGRPIVTTDAPGCRETVVEGESGFLVPPRDPAALAAAMARFLEDPSLAARMGRRARTIAEQRFDVHRVNAVLLAAMGLD